MRAWDMNNHIALFEDIDRALSERFGETSLPFRIIGRSALEMAGLPARGTKDVDALEEYLRVGSLSDERFNEIESFLKDEFGKGSPGAVRHGLYLDLVAQGIPWLPQKARFIDEKKLTSITVSRLHPVDVCASKTFAAFKLGAGRGRDSTDIIEAIDADIVDVAEYVKAMHDAMDFHKIQSGVEVIYPKIIEFVEKEIIARHGDPSIKLGYEIPEWMKNA
jgi:hypothetical protein